MHLSRFVLLGAAALAFTATSVHAQSEFCQAISEKQVAALFEIDCNGAIDAGAYTFKFADGSDIKARYTFTYKWDDGKWSISSHHSSAMPEKN